MKKDILKFLSLFISIILLSSVFYISSAHAENGISLEVTKECDIQYAGDSCVAELKLFNKTGKVLDGTAILHIDYQGICGDGPFDGEGIKVWYNDSLSDSDWNNGEITFSGFNIAKGETQPKLKIKTASNLCPGTYNFTLTLKGIAETGEEYTTTPTTIGGGGGGIVTQTSTLSATAQKVDANKDNKIDVLDFNSLMVNWGKTETGNVADFNGDGKVDVFDFNLLMINWTL